MFAASFFAKSYFLGDYFPPIDSAGNPQPGLEFALFGRQAHAQLHDRQAQSALSISHAHGKIGVSQ